MNDVMIHIGKNFSEFPGGRYRHDGPYSGEQFRDDVLIPALKKHDRVVVVLDGTAGYASSFLEEAFGGLVRAGFRKQDLASRLMVQNLHPNYETYRLLALRYMADAEAAREVA